MTELHLYNVRQAIEGAKENTWAKPLNIILAISIKVLARALSFSETLHAAFRFPSKIITRIPVLLCISIL